jgi:alpha-galactosidase
MTKPRLLLVALLALGWVGRSPAAPATTDPSSTVPVAVVPAVAALPPTLTPPPPETPRINGPGIFGVRPGSPFLYTIPVTGRLPITYAADGLPAGLTVDALTGRISGVLTEPGDHPVRLRASNALGQTERRFLIRVGEAISLTPAMGWNSWNCWAGSVDQEKVMRSARAMVKFGLDRHGWTYINIDDTWQGARGGPLNALQPNEKFPDLKALCDEIHALGLKAGIYSTPWVTSYATHAGGSSENPAGTWAKPTIPKKGNVNKKILPWAIGPYHFMKPDAKQWAQWGFDYLKYDWNPIEAPDVREMAEALRASGRDIVYSLSNSAPFSGGADWARLSNSWRTAGDIRDNWKSMWGEAYGEEKWLPFAGPGHWNDPDMLVVGWLGWGPRLHPSALTADEQYTHLSLWCLLSAPLLIGCDMDRLDPFTVGLLTNDEVLAVDQDSAGRQARRVSEEGDAVVYAKPLEDGSWAVGLFNRGLTPITVTADWTVLGVAGPHRVRDLWRQKELGAFPERFGSTVAPHGVVLVRVLP